MINKLHRTLNSLLKKHYTVEFWSDNNHVIMLSFYHLNSCHNGLCYISKTTGVYAVDFQHHHYNKIVDKQIEKIGGIIFTLYKLGHFDMVKTILDNYHTSARKDYYNIYSIVGGEND